MFFCRLPYESRYILRTVVDAIHAENTFSLDIAQIIPYRAHSTFAFTREASLTFFDDASKKGASRYERKECAQRAQRPAPEPFYDQCHSDNKEKKERDDSGMRKIIHIDAENRRF